MKTNRARLISVAISALVLAVAASSRGQELNIDVPVPPEPGRISGNGREPGKPIPLRRLEPREPDRGDPLRQPGLTAPSLNPAGSRLSPPEPGRIAPEDPLWPAPNSRPVAPREGPAASEGFRLDREPSWANPAAIPLRQSEKPKDAAKPRPRPNQRAAAASSDSRGTANRAAGAEADSPPRAGLLNSGARLAARRAGHDEPAPLLARRHRAEPRERNAKQPPAQDGANRR